MFAKLLSFLAPIKGTAAAGLFAKVLRKVASFIAPRNGKESEEPPK